MALVAECGPERTMIGARVHQGLVEPQDPIPDKWEGQSVKIVPMTPDDPLADLEVRLAALEALGPVEFDLGEREAVARLLAEQDRISRAAMQAIADSQP